MGASKYDNNRPIRGLGRDQIPAYVYDWELVPIDEYESWRYRRLEESIEYHAGRPVPTFFDTVRMPGVEYWDGVEPAR